MKRALPEESFASPEPLRVKSVTSTLRVSGLSADKGRSGGGELTLVLLDDWCLEMKSENIETEMKAEEWEKPRLLSVRSVVAGEGMLALVFVLPAIIAFFFLLAVPSI
jgi:hypothetical protein